MIMNFLKGSQDNESKLKGATTRTTGFQGPGRRQQVARERPEQSSSQVSVPAD